MGINIAFIKKHKWWFIAIGIVIVLWGINLTIYLLSEETDLGKLGDIFGAVNALFSGLAFAGIIISIRMQSKELKLQRREIKLQRKELQATKLVFEKQSKIMDEQRNDATFFNLLSNHRELVNSFTRGEMQFNNMGKSIAKGNLESRLEAVSGYEVLRQIAQRWIEYGSSYSNSFKSKLILDLLLYKFETFEKMVNSYPITHVHFRELIHIFKFVDKRFTGDDLKFYRDTIYKSLTQDERFIFEAIYANFPSEREGVEIETSYYDLHQLVDFNESKLPCVKVYNCGKFPKYSTVGVEHNSILHRATLIVYQQDYENNLTLHDKVIIPIKDNLMSQKFILSLEDVLLNSKFGLTEYPFLQNGEKLENMRYAYLFNFNHHENNIAFAFSVTAQIDHKINKEGYPNYELKNFDLKELTHDTYISLMKLCDY